MRGRPGALEESDGSKSMRRLLALLFGACGLFAFVVASLENSQWGFWSGVACCFAVSILLGLTTLEEVSRITRYLPGESRDRSSTESPYIPGLPPVEEEHG